MAIEEGRMLLLDEWLQTQREGQLGGDNILIQALSRSQLGDNKIRSDEYAWVYEKGILHIRKLLLA